MRTLLVLLAAMLSLGAYFADAKPAHDPELDADRLICRNEACKVHAPYYDARTPGRDWPESPTPGPDPNCDLRGARRP